MKIIKCLFYRSVEITADEFLDIEKNAYAANTIITQDLIIFLKSFLKNETKKISK